MCEAATIRVLFSTTPGYGHFHPLVPLARAFVDDGHEVVFATAASFGGHVEATGFRTVAAGMQPDEIAARFAPYRGRLAEMPIADRRPYAFTWRFATVEAPGKLPDLMEAAARLEPDLLVYESGDLAAPVTASALGVPSVHHGFGRLVPVACYERAAPEVDALWRGVDLEPEPLCGAFSRLYLDICPPSFQTASMPPGATSALIRPEFVARVGEAMPAWLEALPDRPTVYVTLGTVINALPEFRVLLDGLTDVDCNVVATIGLDNDPALLEPLPPNAWVERYVSQALVLPHASVVVSHGGSGAVLATFARGLPTLLLPHAADQFENAERCVELGAGLALLPGEVTPDAVRAGVERLIGEPAFRERAGEVAAELAAMPAPRDVARRLVEAR